MSQQRAIESGPRVDPAHAQLHVQLDLLQLCVDPRDVLEVDDGVLAGGAEEQEEGNQGVHPLKSRGCVRNVLLRYL